MMRLLSLTLRMGIHFCIMISALKLWEIAFSQPSHVERLIILGVVGALIFPFLYRPWLWPRSEDGF